MVQAGAPTVGDFLAAGDARYLGISTALVGDVVGTPAATVVQNAGGRIVQTTENLVTLVAAASPGDLFILEPGVHTVTAQVLMAVSRVKIIGPRGARVEGDGSGLTQIFRITASDVTLGGFEVLSPTDDGHCIRIDVAANQERIYLERLHISKAGRNVVGQGVNITLDPTFNINDLHIVGCYFDMTNLENAIRTGTSSAGLIRPKVIGNKFVGVASSAFPQAAMDFRLTGTGIRAGLIALNDIEEAVTFGIEVGTGEDVRIEANYIRRPGGGRMDTGIVSAANPTVIVGNVIIDCDVDGISVTNRALIVGNEIRGCPTGIRNTSGNTRWHSNNISNFSTAVVNTGSTGTQSDHTLDVKTFSATQFDDPNNADWALNGVAPSIADENNNGLTVRRFVETGETGVGFYLDVPAEATQVRFDFIVRQEDATPSPGNIAINIYEREMANGALTTAWGAAVNNIITSLPANENWAEFTIEGSLATFGLGIDRMHQLEITRDGLLAGDTLDAPLNLVALRVRFT